MKGKFIAIEETVSIPGVDQNLMPIDFGSIKISNKKEKSKPLSGICGPARARCRRDHHRAGQSGKRTRFCGCIGKLPYTRCVL